MVKISPLIKTKYQLKQFVKVDNGYTCPGEFLNKKNPKLNVLEPEL